MEILDKAVLPQSAHHMVLIKYLIVAAQVIFVSYTGLLFGSLAFSLYFRKRALIKKDETYYKLAEEIIESVTFNRVIAIGLGLVPLLSCMFGYAQLLNGTGSSAEGYLFVSALFLFNAILLVHSYKNGFFFDLNSLNYGQSHIAESDLKKNKKRSKAVKLFGKSGQFAFIFLLISIYLFSFAVQLATDTSRWNDIQNIWQVIFSLDSFVFFLQFISLSVTITSGMILYRYFRTNSEITEISIEHKNNLREFLLNRGLISMILLLCFIVLSVMVRSRYSLSYNVFLYSAAALCLILLVSSFYYLMIKQSDAKYSTTSLFLMMIVVFILIIRDQYSFDVSTKKQFAILASNYNAFEAGVKEKLGLGEAVISGADIYNGRCIACHNFDKKIVGPPYNQTLPKYVGKKDLLIKYILNPVKINPDYPAMPNQGLKPKEADAVA